ncbi:MAG: GntR family transcriptional regulator [Gordonia sp. (in: high G+C Gram-positive bacteria)]
MTTDDLPGSPTLPPDPRRPGSAREAYMRQRHAAATARRVSRATYAQLRAGIRDGAIAFEERLNEGDLVTMYAANRNAIRRALQMLASDGLVERHTRTGTVVTSAIVEFSATGVLPTTNVADLRVVELDQAVVPTPPVIARRMATDSPAVLAFTQLGLMGDVPLYVRSGYAPQLDVGPDFFDQVVESDQDFRPTAIAFRQLFGADLGRVETAVEWAPAGSVLSPLLGLDPGTPLLMRDMVLFDVHGLARELSFTYFRGDRVSLTYDESWPAPATS